MVMHDNLFKKVFVWSALSVAFMVTSMAFDDEIYSDVSFLSLNKCAELKEDFRLSLCTVQTLGKLNPSTTSTLTISVRSHICQMNLVHYFFRRHSQTHSSLIFVSIWIFCFFSTRITQFHSISVGICTAFHEKVLIWVCCANNSRPSTVNTNQICIMRKDLHFSLKCTRGFACASVTIVASFIVVINISGRIGKKIKIHGTSRTHGPNITSDRCENKT